MTDPGPSVAVPAPDAAYDAWERTGRAGGGSGWNTLEATSSNVRLSADHVRVTPNGRQWCRVVGTTIRDPGCPSRRIGSFGEAQVSRVDSLFDPD